MTLQLMLIWDYDTPTGFDVSAHSRHADPLSDYTTTDRVLDLLATHDIVATFACVGLAAEDGPLPYHNPAQIRAIHAAGHEVASHAYRHELLPALSTAALMETCRASKAALEACLGAPVTGFVPPWNRPFHHPRRLAFSGQDWRDGRWRQSVTSLCAVLAACGYRWVRVHYAPIYEQLRRKLQPARVRAVRPLATDCFHGVQTLRLGYLGYDRRLIEWLITNHDKERAAVIYAHPHGIAHENSQHWRHLQQFTAWYSANKDRYDLTFTTPTAWLDGAARDRAATRQLA